MAVPSRRSRCEYTLRTLSKLVSDSRNLNRPKATLAAVITAWENTDNLMEKVLVTFDAPDQTPDPNHTARDATKKEVDEYLANNGPITCPLPRVMKPVEAKAALANLV